MSRVLVQATWDDVPHLTEEQKKAQWESAPIHEREARAKGIPSLGSGRIFPISEESLLVEPFELPRYWPRAYGFDPDWNRTAAVWGAWDRDSDIVYIYSEYFAGQVPPAVHASAIQSRGAWMTGAVDPSIHGKRNVTDGRVLTEEYRGLGLNLVNADNSVEAGIFASHQRMSTGGLKVFTTCRNWISEFRIYRRDEHGKVVKERDDIMDASRYLVMTGMRVATIEPDEIEEMEARQAMNGRNPVTGY